MAGKKKITAPAVRSAHFDPEEKNLSFEMTGATHQVEVDKDGIPAIVLELAHKVEEEPWTWFIAKDHVSIVARRGKKYRFERESTI
jgi:hypothetical protein